MDRQFTYAFDGIGNRTDKGYQTNAANQYRFNPDADAGEGAQVRYNDRGDLTTDGVFTSADPDAQGDAWFGLGAILIAPKIVGEVVPSRHNRVRSAKRSLTLTSTATSYGSSSGIDVLVGRRAGRLAKLVTCCGTTRIPPP